METIQVVLGAKLLKAADLAAKRQKVKRSVLIRNALQEHLKRLHEFEKAGTGMDIPPSRSAAKNRVWEDASVWPTTDPGRYPPMPFRTAR